MDVLKFLRFKGFSEEEIYKELYDSGNTKMSTKMPNRDDFGLPKDANKMKESICHKEEFPTHAHKVGDKFPPNVSNVSGPSGVKDNLGHEKSEKSGPQSSSQTKSWSQVTRKWVRKEKVDVNAGIIPSQTAALMADESKSSPLTGITANPEPLLKDATPAKRPPSPSGQDLSDTSATPLCTFRNLKKVDEIDMKKDVSTSSELGEFQLSRSQRKKLRKQGKSPIPPSL
ncbi:hypothetical protein ACET3Z_031571 [Daucus carota]